ncbi:hypothetical protein EV126DRAFT_495737 [Verticillium dahliae]|nr:hypothetical protein EV126DRAFT_495737 [Verticillium dahliae]
MRKHRSDKHRPRSEWSEWIWSEEHGTWYHVRQRSNGEWLYEDQNGQALGGAAAEDSATPRQDMDDLVQGLSTLSTNAEDDFEADDGLGEASTQQTEYQFTNATHESDRSRRHRHKGKNKHVTYEDVLEQEQVPEPEGAGAYEPNPGPEVNPTKGASSSRGAYGAQQDHISGDGQVGDREVLDKRRLLEHLCSKCYGQNLWESWRAPPRFPIEDALRDRYGGLVHVGFRRFIVIATDEGHSTCVYEKGVKPRHHGIIYTSKEPLMLEGEPTLGAPPARMEVTTKGEKLSKSSRANYSKMMTVEHNVKVMQDNDDGQAM